MSPGLIAVSAAALVTMTSLARGFTLGERVVETGGWLLLAGAAPACVGVALLFGRRGRRRSAGQVTAANPRFGV